MRKEEGEEDTIGNFRNVSGSDTHHFLHSVARILLLGLPNCKGWQKMPFSSVPIKDREQFGEFLVREAFTKYIPNQVSHLEVPAQ